MTAGKMRPALVLRRLPGFHNDWLVCMISSQLDSQIRGMDEMIFETDGDFQVTGLKSNSVIRITRLAVVAGSILHGAVGELSKERLNAIQARLADWILGSRKVRE
jgi:mRNA interferase MazF